MKEMTVPATVDELYKVQDFVEEQLTQHDCAPKVIVQIAIAVEEIYVNIAKYAYFPEVGEATIRCKVGEMPLKVMIQFMDNGNPFNPLAREEVDITVPVEQRGVGGLGILLVKQSMDQVEYSYESGNNILTIMKEIN